MEDPPRRPVPETTFSQQPGVYVVWEVGHPVALYVGVAASRTLDARWRDHLRGPSGKSALRRSVSVYRGLVEKKLVRPDGTSYPPKVEQAITDFLLDCEVQLYPTADGAEAKALEDQLIVELHPRLNINRPRVRRTAAEKALLANAARTFREHVKPAVLSGLRAVAPDVQLTSSRNYVVDVADNLLPRITLASIAPDFEEAAGHELKSKMKAPWSSSALAVNFFARWRDDPSKLRLAGHRGFAPRFHFERPCPNKVSRIYPPHLDVILERGAAVYAVESKFTEYLQGTNHPPVAAAYKRLRDKGDERAGSRWFMALDNVESFLLLDAYQLVKHYLGIILSYPGRELTMVYLYWEPTNPLEGATASLVERHRAEVASFARLVADDPTCQFVSLSYEQHWHELAAMEDKPRWLDDHLELLRKRYLVEVV